MAWGGGHRLGQQPLSLAAPGTWHKGSFDSDGARQRCSCCTCVALHFYGDYRGEGPRNSKIKSYKGQDMMPF